MTIDFIKQASCYIPKVFLQSSLLLVIKELKKHKIYIPKEKKNISLVFVSSKKMQNLNYRYRKKNKITDILSFSSLLGDSFGDLIFDCSLVKKQAISNKHSQKQELLYLLIHGVLHLLGLDHEKSAAEAKKMYNIQDSIFEKLQPK